MRFSFATLILFLTCCYNSSFAQQPTTQKDLSDLKELIIKEDFENLSKFLRTNNLTIIKSDLNYSHGNYYVIAEIECEKKLPTIKSKKAEYLDIENVEKLSIKFIEKDDYKELEINQNFILTNKEFVNHYYEWKSMNWTYVGLGELSSFSKDKGYQLGDMGWLGMSGEQLKKIPTESLKLTSDGKEWSSVNSTYKKMHFRNYNASLGTLCDYRCELIDPLPKEEFHLFLMDTTYRFYLTMKEYYPKFNQKTNTSTASNFISIPLMKSGTIFFINISIGGNKKRYILDSGASDVTLDETTYKHLFQTGVIKIKHKLSDGEYQLADGTTKSYKRTLIPEITIDNITIKNVAATIIPDGQPLLLGKSLLDNFKTWKIDNSKNTLIVEVQ